MCLHLTGPMQLAVCPEQSAIAVIHFKKKKKKGTQQAFKFNLSCESTCQVRAINDSSYQ